MTDTSRRVPNRIRISLHLQARLQFFFFRIVTGEESQKEQEDWGCDSYIA